MCCVADVDAARMQAVCAGCMDGAVLSKSVRMRSMAAEKLLNVQAESGASAACAPIMFLEWPALETTSASMNCTRSGGVNTAAADGTHAVCVCNSRGMAIA
jgi:hypothetical protein